MLAFLILLPKRHGGQDAAKGLRIGAAVGIAVWTLFFIVGLWLAKCAPWQFSLNAPASQNSIIAIHSKEM